MHIFVNKLKIKEMKKITLSLCTLLAGTIGFSQNSESSLVGYAENPVNNNIVMDPCSQDFDEAALTLANAITDHGPFVVANDFMVDAETAFELEEVTFLLLSLSNDFTDIVNAEIFIYEDQGVDEPNSSYEVASSTILNIDVETHPDTFAGYTMFIATYEFDETIILNNPGNTPKKYWLALSVTSGSATHAYWVGYIWDATHGSSVNFQSQDGGITYAPIVSANYPGEFFDSVWSIDGQCTPATLSVADNLASQIAIYPTPAVDVINIKTPASMEINEVSLFDIQGRNTGAVYTNGTVNVSGLSRGVYMLTVKTSEGTLTQKVVKK